MFPLALYQLALRTPGITPWSARLRKQIRQTPNLRNTPLGRPHNLQRRSRRTGYFGRDALAIFDFLATAKARLKNLLTIQMLRLAIPCQQTGAFRVIPCHRCGKLIYWLSFVLNGMPNIRNSSRPSSSLFVEVTNTMFMPCLRVNLSGFNSGNTRYSFRPKL